LRLWSRRLAIRTAAAKQIGEDVAEAAAAAGSLTSRTAKVETRKIERRTARVSRSGGAGFRRIRQIV